jgi:hypothetical protein
VEAKIRLKPSLEIAGCESLYAELTTAGQVVPSLSLIALRFIGADQGP